MKRSIHAALVAAFGLSLGPFLFSGARSVSTVPSPVAKQVASVAAGSVSVASPSAPQQSTQYAVKPKQVALSSSASAKPVKHKRAMARVTKRPAKKPPGKVVAKKSNPVIARRALQVAKKMNTVGWCYRGVCRALRPLGISLSGGAAYEAKDQLLKDSRFEAFAISGVRDLRPGDILVHGANAKHPYGHIAVYLGNKKEASDHVQRVIVNGPYSGTTVFRYGANEPALSMANEG